MKRNLALIAGLVLGLGLASTAEAQVFVRAPFVRVQVGGGVWVRAPFVNLWVPPGPGYYGPRYYAPPVMFAPPAPTVVQSPPPQTIEPQQQQPIPQPQTTPQQQPVPQPQPVPQQPLPNNDATPPQPSKAVAVPTLEQFAGTFQPKGGNYEVTIMSPVTNQATPVRFSLPEGNPRRVHVRRNEIEFDYGIRHFVRIEFDNEGAMVTSR
jgi:outer membrane biosynthesis protein TonB